MKQWKISLIVMAFSLASVNAFGDETITLRSGNGGGGVGSSDSQITRLDGPFETPFLSAFVAGDFLAARTGPSAILSFLVGSGLQWKSALDYDSTALWLSTHDNTSPENYGDTALFAMEFTVATLGITSATMDFHFMIDNELGDANNEGIFLNEQAISGTKSLGVVEAQYEVDQMFDNLDITSAIQTGTNTLYVNMADSGGPSGLVFSAEITVIPEPGTLSLLAIGGLVMLRRKK